MDYIKVNGFNGGKLYYLPKEKHLFLRKTSKNEKTYLICYDTIMAKKSANACSARCRLDESTGECLRTVTNHCNHESHEIIFQDLVSLNAMKDQCRYLAEKFPFSAHLIPISEIFLIEMSK